MVALKEAPNRANPDFALMCINQASLDPQVPRQIEVEFIEETRNRSLYVHWHRSATVRRYRTSDSGLGSAGDGRDSGPLGTLLSRQFDHSRFLNPYD